LAYTSTRLSPHDKSKLIETYGEDKLEFNWGMSEFGILYIMGFKWCDRCIVMMKIDDISCPICGRRLRTKPRGRRR
jgi:hypothetical protein